MPRRKQSLGLIESKLTTDASGVTRGVRQATNSYARFSRDLKRQSAAVEKISQRMVAAGAAITAAFAARFAVAGIKEFISSAGESAIILERNARAIGTSAAEAQNLSRILEDLGEDNPTGFLSRLAEFGLDAAEGFRTIADLPVAGIREFIDEFSRVEGVVDRLRILQRFIRELSADDQRAVLFPIFGGEDSVFALNILLGESIDKQLELAGAIGNTNDEQLRAVRQVGRGLLRIQRAFQNLQFQIIEDLNLHPLLDQVALLPREIGRALRGEESALAGALGEIGKKSGQAFVRFFREVAIPGLAAAVSGAASGIVGALFSGAEARTTLEMELAADDIVRQIDAQTRLLDETLRAAGATVDPRERAAFRLATRGIEKRIAELREQQRRLNVRIRDAGEELLDVSPAQTRQLRAARAAVDAQRQFLDATRTQFPAASKALEFHETRLRDLEEAYADLRFSLGAGGDFFGEATPSLQPYIAGLAKVQSAAKKTGAAVKAALSPARTEGQLELFGARAVDDASLRIAGYASRTRVAAAATAAIGAAAKETAAAVREINLDDLAAQLPVLQPDAIDPLPVGMRSGWGLALQRDAEEGADAVAGATERIAESYDALSASVRGSVGDFFRDFIAGTESAGDAFENLGRRIQNILLETVADRAFGGLFDRLLGGGAGGGGLLDSLFRFLGIPTAALGGQVGPGFAVVGERGPELAYFAQPTRIDPDARLGGVTIQNNVTVTGGASREEVRAAMTEAYAASVRDLARAAPAATLASPRVRYRMG